MSVSRVILAFGVIAAIAVPPALADEPTKYEWTIKGHAFDPPELRVPAGKAFVLKLKNLDPTPAEFESHSMKVEKIVAGNAEVTVRVKALKAGTYDMFDEFHEDETKATLVAE